MLDSTGDGISSSGSIKDGGSAIVTGVQSVEGEVLELTQPVRLCVCVCVRACAYVSVCLSICVHMCTSTCQQTHWLCSIHSQVTISENVEKWLSSLVDNTHETIGSLMHDIVLECGALSVDDCACKVSTYVHVHSYHAQSILIKHTGNSGSLFYCNIL